MAIHSRRARNQAFAILVVLTLSVIQLQLVTAGSASATSACNGAFQGSLSGTLAITSSVAAGQSVQPGQSIVVTATWDPDDWNGVDAYNNCWQLNGDALASLELEAKPPANDGSMVQTVTVPNVSDGDTMCVRSRLSGQPRGGNATTQKSNHLCWIVHTTVAPKRNVALDADSTCNRTTGHVIIDATLTNHGSMDVDVVATDVTFSGDSAGPVTIAPGGAHTFTIDAGQPPLPSGTVRFDLTWEDGVTQSLTAKHSSTPACLPDVKITKTASQINLSAGDSFNWILKVENVSSTNATNVAITDKIVASLTIGTLPAGCTRTGQDVTCNIGNLAAGASATRSIPVTTSNGSCPSVDNTGKVTAVNDSNWGNNDDRASVNVACAQPDVTIEKTPSKANVDAGDSFNWVLRVRNTSSVGATGVTIDDSVPASLTIGTLPAGCTKTGQDVTCNIGNLAAGASATRSIPVTTTNASCPSVENTGTVAADVDTDNTNNSDSASVGVNCVQPDVKIEKTATQASVNAGDSFNWVLEVTNTTSVSATTVKMTDSIPASLTIGTLPAGCSAVGQDVTCNIGTLAGGASATRSIPVTTSDSSCPKVDNTGFVTAAVDIDGTNNSDSASVDVTCGQSDVKIEKTASKSAVTAGDPFTYTLKITSIGMGTATDVVVHDDIPASLVVGVMPAGCTKAGQTVTCNAGNLASGETKTFQIPVTTTTGSCPSVDNTGTVTADNDSDNTNNSDSVSVDVVCNQPDVIVTKASSVSTVNANGSATFTLTAENQGLADATGVQVKDTFAPTLTITNAGACNVAGQLVTCDLGTVAAGASKSVAITVTAIDGACPSVNNSAEVSATNEPLSNAGNNVSNLVTLNVVCPNPDVAISKSSNAPVEGVFSGDSFAYAITVDNVSTGDVNDVVVHDSIPAGLTITDAGSCTVSGQDVTCDLGTVTAGASKTVTITVTATDAACPEVTNTATVEGANDSVGSNNTSSPVTDIVNCAEPNIAIKVTKENDGNTDGRYSDAEEAKRSGLDVPFRLVITNTGNETVLIDELTDTFPGDVVDLLNNHCANLDGRSLAPGKSVKCLFSLKNYSPDSDAGFKANTAAVCVRMDGDSTKTACDDNDSKVRSSEVLGRTVTPPPTHTPPPTQTPPSGIAFTGSDGTIGFGLLAMALLLVGTGALYAGYRRRQRFES
jgi:fimbrial isopeptide formation D2 family protein/uncharacterized repeat protein (TIGR01451 family)